jgi:colanic acid biosynthesis glycosyl transferase WcaI
MKICLVSLYFLPEIGAGSTQTYYRAIGLEDRGNAVTVLTSMGSRSKHRKSFWPKFFIREEIAGVKVIRVWKPNLPYASLVVRGLNVLVFSVLASIVLLAQRFDAIVGAGAPSPMIWNIPFLFQSRLRKTPIVLTENDSIPNTLEGFMPKIRNTILWPLATYLSKFIEFSVSHIITYTEEIKQLIIQRGTSPKKITVIPLPVDTSIMRPVSTGVSEIKDNMFHGKFTVMYSGALTPSYDFDVFLEVASSLSHENILFVLRGWGPLYFSIKNAIEKRKLANVKVLQEKLNFEDLVVLFSAVDLFFIPLKNIPVWSDVIIPTKLNDFISCGKPVVASSGKATSELINNNGIGEAVPTGRIDLIAKAIMKFHDDKDYLSSVGYKARSFAIEYCGIKKVTKELERVLLDIVSRN